MCALAFFVSVLCSHGVSLCCAIRYVYTTQVFVFIFVYEYDCENESVYVCECKLNQFDVIYVVPSVENTFWSDKEWDELI